MNFEKLENQWEAKNPYLDSDTVENSNRTHRINICQHCEHLSNLKFCNKCNCFMPIKVYFKFSKCPLNQW